MEPVQPIDRRAFVLGSLWGLGGLAMPTLAGGQTARGPARTLVLIQLTGGNDGLSTLVPHGEDAYARARRATRFATDEVLRLDERFGLHPKLVRLREIFEHGRLALVQGVGYPEPNRSHFRSMDIWHAADARGRAAGTGWIGRCIAGLRDPSPHAVVHFGVEPPFSLQSAHAPLCVTSAILDATDPAKKRALPLDAPELSVQDQSRARPEHPCSTSQPASGAIAALRERISETSSSLATLRAALAHPNPKVAYPGSPFSQDLRRAAALIHAELGVRVCSLELDGFDTHGNQRGRHDQLMGELDRSLDAFTKDLQKSEAGREALILLFSEFGRRVEENASGGTDHGAAGLAMALGANVKGGLYGPAPSLDALQDGDLAFTTDFRSLYAPAIEHVFELEPAAILGGTFPKIELV